MPINIKYEVFRILSKNLKFSWIFPGHEGRTKESSDRDQLHFRSGLTSSRTESRLIYDIEMSGRSLSVVLGASSILLLGFTTWRARKRGRTAAEQAEAMVADGPMVRKCV